MKQYRITKYNPQFRNAKGHYTIDEWTDFSDVGKIFNGMTITMEDYLEYENAYIKTAIVILERCNVEKITVKELEIYNDSHSITENEVVKTNVISKTIQNILRNNFWCKLETKDFYIHFGFDYYMYIGCHLEIQQVAEIVNDNHLYFEEISSPYNKTDRF